MTNTTLRKATAADAKEIRALIWRVGINPISLDWRRFLVAVDAQDRVIGTGQIKPHGDGTREMASIAVQPEWQGQGIGTAIIERLLAENGLDNTVSEGQAHADLAPAKLAPANPALANLAPPLYLTCRAHMEPYYVHFGFRALQAEEMPPYFRRLYRLARFFQRISPRMGEMRVMCKSA